MDPESVLSIGALSRATGVPVETLRTWERRYGFPAPIERSGSSHRRYPLDSVERLRLAVRAIESGHQPSVALRAGVQTLRQMLAVAGAARPPRARVAPERSFVERCLEHTVALDGEALMGEFERAYSEVGVLESMTGCFGPFLRALGDCWSRGELEVGHEHFASEHLRRFLNENQPSGGPPARAPRIVCGTLSGERHVLGLHLAAVALAHAGARVVFLGADTPPADVAAAADRWRAHGVALSAAEGADRGVLSRQVRALRKALPEKTPILVGGTGFDPPMEAVFFEPDLTRVGAWLHKLEKK
jgi:methylmalonyl-CoA mutase cobalamin-binding subunit